MQDDEKKIPIHFGRKRSKVTNSTNDALSNDTKVNDLVILTLTLKLKIVFWTLLPPGAYCSVSQTHLHVLFCRRHMHSSECCHYFYTYTKVNDLVPLTATGHFQTLLASGGGGQIVIQTDLVLIFVYYQY